MNCAGTLDKALARRPVLPCAVRCLHKTLLGIALLASSGIFAPVEAQFANGYSFRRSVDFVDAQVIGGPHTNFPVLVSAVLPDLRTIANGGSVQDADGFDIVFASDPNGAIPLAHEIENYNPATGEIHAWVRIESFASTTLIYLFYGNSSIAAFQGNIASNGATGVWASEFRGVWHLDEATDDPNLDSTSNNNDGTPHGSPLASTGKIAGALDFDVPGPATRVDFPASTSLDVTGLGNWTMSAWVRPTDYTGVKWPTVYGYGVDATLGLTVQEGTEGTIEHWQNDTIDLHGNTVAEFNQWSHIVVVREPLITSFYLNGAVDGTAPSVQINGPGQESAIGSTAVYPVDDDLLGLIDEVRVTSSALSPQWIQTEYNNQSAPQLFYVISGASLAPLQIVKRAFQIDGTPIASGSTLPSGMPVRFLLYINNPSALRADVSMQDVLDPLFAYTPGSLQYATSLPDCVSVTCTSTEEAVIFATLEASVPRTDFVDLDVVSISGATIEIGDQNVANAQLDIPANSVWAVAFTTRIQ